MKNNISIFLVTFLYILTFFFLDNAGFKEILPILNKIDFEDILPEDNIRKSEKTSKNSEKEHNLDVKLKNFEKYYPKKFHYPSSYKKGKITLFINNPYEFDKPSFDTKTDACRVLVSKINSAQKSIDFAIYGFSSQNEIINSLINASKRDVQINGVLDSDKNGIMTYKDDVKLKDFVNMNFDNSRYLMHDKFFIIDDDFLLTGSMNISNTGCGGYNSNSVLIIEDEAVISLYKKELNQMLDGKFQNKKENFSKNNIQSGETILGVYFSPVGKVYENLISNELKSAKEKINMSAFVLTLPLLKDELINASKRGVKVRVILDSLGAIRQKKLIGELRENGIKVKIENFGGKNHEKTIQIDNDILILGSANFSYSGFNKNDENVVFIKDKDFAKFYSDYFDKFYLSINDIYLKRFPRAEGLESENSCFDKIDNNFDENADSKDLGCKI